MKEADEKTILILFIVAPIAGIVLGILLNAPS